MYPTIEISIAPEIQLQMHFGAGGFVVLTHHYSHQTGLQVGAVVSVGTQRECDEAAYQVREKLKGAQHLRDGITTVLSCLVGKQQTLQDLSEIAVEVWSIAVLSERMNAQVERVAKERAETMTPAEMRKAYEGRANDYR